MSTIDVISVKALRGPNIWSASTVLEVSVEVRAGELAIDPFLARLRGLLPRLELSSAAAQTPSGALAFALEGATMALQRAAGCPVAFARTSWGEGVGAFELILEYSEEALARRVLASACELVLAAADGRPFDLAGESIRLRSAYEQTRLGPTTGSIVAAAVARGIPVRRLNEGSLVQLGFGALQHRILAAETERTGAIAESIAQDKELTKMLLSAVGVPVPEGRTVKSAEDAWTAATEFGLPVVVKPRYGNQGRGVAVNLQSRDQVFAAYDAALEEGSAVMVERFAPGMDHRLLMVGGKLVAAARREPPQVIGDGERSVRQLVAQENLDPRRGEAHATAQSKIPIDAIAAAVLDEQGLGPDSVPAAGLRVYLRRNANLSTGGSATDITDEVHPEVAARAADAVRVVGLDIAGVDVVCRDISKPLEGQNGVLVEVNAAPGFRMHLQPSHGRARPVGEAVVSSLFAPGDTGRVPLVAVSGNNGKTSTARLTAHLLATSGPCVGMTCTDGIYVGARRLEHGDCAGPKSARAVLLNPRVEAAVFETARGGILREGLGFDECDVAIVTNIGTGDHLGIGGITTPEQLAAVKRVIVESVSRQGTAVLNAADPLTVAMASACRGSVTLFARERSLPALSAHASRGGRVVYVEAATIWAAQGTTRQRVTSLAEVPLTRGGLVRFHVENALAATAAAWALGLPWDIIRRGLSTFASSADGLPGRFNVYEHAGATVVADYGHNVDALSALVDALDRMSRKRRLVALTAAGDRRDVDLLGIGRVIGANFDDVILFEDACNRGRPAGEVMRLLRDGVAAGGRASAVTEMSGELAALETAMSRLRPGELGLLLVDQIAVAMRFIENYLSQAPGLS